jgi:hypothetical protein
MKEALTKRIEETAYYLWLRDGCPEGRSHDYWLRAEAEVMSAIANDDAPIPAPVQEVAPSQEVAPEAVIEAAPKKTPARKAPARKAPAKAATEKTDTPKTTTPKKSTTRKAPAKAAAKVEDKPVS